MDIFQNLHGPDLDWISWSERCQGTQVGQAGTLESFRDVFRPSYHLVRNMSTSAQLDKIPPSLDNFDNKEKLSLNTKVARKNTEYC